MFEKRRNLVVFLSVAALLVALQTTGGGRRVGAVAKSEKLESQRSRGQRLLRPWRLLARLWCLKVLARTGGHVRPSVGSVRNFV